MEARSLHIKRLIMAARSGSGSATPHLTHLLASLL